MRAEETGTLISIGSKRDLLAGAIVAGFGAIGVYDGLRLRMGTIHDMGPGYVPTWIGVILLGLGLLLALRRPEPDEDAGAILAGTEWRGGLCIVAGVASFIILGQYAGFVVASLVSVFISAMGDRSTTPIAALVLAAGVTVFGVLLFHYLLGIPIPLFGGDS